MNGFLLVSSEEQTPMFLVDQRPFPILKFTGTEASEVEVLKTLQKVDTSTPEALKKYAVLLKRGEALFRHEYEVFKQKRLDT
jgi:hypothetical protein